jgi:hypothetical protein
MMDGQENETKGVLFCKSLYGEETRWKQTSYNGSFRKNYAGPSYTYDEQRDAFIPPKPYPSWVLDENTCQWGSPTPMPTDDKLYTWNEESTSWVEIPQSL